MGELWQNPHVNLFKHFGVGQWKKCGKVGEVLSLMDRVIKCPTYKISGVVPANNYITIPKHNSQSAGLSGNYLFILFKPSPDQFFTIHLEVTTSCGVIIRVSISNIYKQFKASATWLQFPYLSTDPSQLGWSVLLFNFPHLLRKYINRQFSHLKSIKLCANMFVKNVFTTSRPYNPLVTDKKVLKIDDLTVAGDEPFPRELRYPVPSGHEWDEFYHFIKFPPTSENLSVVIQNNEKTGKVVNPTFVSSKNGERLFRELPVVRNKASNVTLSVKKKKKTSEQIDDDFQNMSLIENVTISALNKPSKAARQIPPKFCDLKKIVGFGPCRHVEFSSDNIGFYYAAGSILIRQSIDEPFSQTMFTGHTHDIIAFSKNSTDEFLASSQKESPLVRVWSITSRECIALVKSGEDPCTSLQFSATERVLLGVTSQRPRSKLILWDTSLLKLKGDISIVSEGSCSDVLLHARLSPLNSGKLASCSARSLQIWRLRAGKLKSCAISVFSGLELVLRDVAWGCVGMNTEQNVYLATAAGLVIQVDTSKATVTRTIDLCAVEGPGVKYINSLEIHEAFAVTATDDGSLKVWDPAFKECLLTVEHESAVTCCHVANDGMKLLAVTETGSVGMLDASNKSYKTVLRSHNKKITAVAVDPCHRQFATISQDCSLRVWDLESLSQIYEVFSAGETPTTIAYHPYKGNLVAGYSKGTVRVIEDGEVTDEICDLSSAVTSTTLLPNGEFLYTSDALGTLAVYPATKSSLLRSKSFKHMVAKGSHRGPDAVQASRDSRLIAFVGPTEHCVTVLDTTTLACLTKLDIASAVASCLDSVTGVRFGTVLSRDLFVSTTSGKVLRVDTRTGVIVSDHQPYPSSPPLLLLSDNYIITANSNKFSVCDYQTLGTIQKYLAHDRVNHMAFTPGLTHLILCGEQVTIWSFNGGKPLLQNGTALQKKVSFDQYQPTGTPNGRSLVSVEETALYTPVLEPPQPDTLQPVQSDIRLEETLDASGEKTLDLSSILLNPSPPPAPQPPVQTVKVSEFSDEVAENSDLEKVSSLSEVNSEEEPLALCPNNGKHPFQLSPDAATPPSPEASVEAPLSLRHISIDPPKSTLSSKRYLASVGESGLELVTLLGNEREARDNVVWSGTTIFYSLGNVVIAEDLKTSKQMHLIEHVEVITCITGSNTNLLASCSGAHKLQPSQICVWDAETYELLHTLNYHEALVQCVEFTVDASHLVSIGNYRENALVLWDMSSYDVMNVAKTEGHVNCVACDPQNATEFVTVGKCVQFWILDHKNELSVATGSLPVKFQRSIGDDVEYTAVTYTDTGMVYVGTGSGYITLWDPRTTACVLHWDACPNEVDVLCYNNRSLVSGGVGKSLKLWDIQNTETDDTSVMLQDEIELDSAVVSCVMDTSLNLGIAGTVAGTLWYVNWEDKSSIRLVGGTPDTVNDIATEGATFAGALQDGSLRIWNHDPLEQAVQFQVLSTSCTCVAYKPRASTCVSAGYGDGTIRSFDLTTASMVCKMAPHKNAISILKYSPSGDVLISGDASGVVSVINSETGLIMRVISDHKRACVTSLDFSSLSKNWLVASADRRLSVWAADWDVDKNKMIAWLSFPAPSFSPSGGASSLSSLPPSLALFSPLERNTIVYTGYGLHQEILIYNFVKKQTVRKLDLAHWASSLDIIPNSNLLLIGSHDRIVSIVDYTSGTFQDYVSHSDEVGVVRYCQKNNMVLTAAGSSIALWNVKV